MTLELSQFDVMTYLWETMEKTEDGEHIRYTPHDIDMLWNMGFVDTVRTSLSAWHAVLEPHREAGGTFLLSRDAFMQLEAYRYTGEIHVPFDAMQINEGRYTDEGLSELFAASIAPSCGLSDEKLAKFIDELKTAHREPSGLIRIAVDAKLKVKRLLDDFPSPLRNLEILFDQMLEQGVDHEVRQEKQVAHNEVTRRESERQFSNFSATPLSHTEAHARGLKAMTKARPKTASISQSGKKGETELKKIRRSRKGLRG